MSITITVPNDDHVALRAMAKALEEIAVARGAPEQAHTLVRERVGEVEREYLTREAVAQRLKVATEDLTRAAPAMLRENDVDGGIELHGKRKQVEADTTSEQFESLKLGEESATTDSTGTPWDERIHSVSKALNSDGTWRLRRKPKDMDEAEWAALVESVKDELQHGDAIREAMDKAERGEAVYYTSEQAEQKMEEFKESVRQRGEANKGVTVISQEDVEVVSEELCIDEGCDHHGTPHICVTPEPSVTPEGDDFHVDTGEVTEQEVASIPVPPLPVPPAPPVFVTVQEVDEPTMSFPDVMKFLTERHARISNEQVTEIITAMGLKSIMDLNTQPEHTGPFIARVKALLGE